MLWETYRTVGLAGQCFMLGDLYPSKSGLTHKYIVKHIGRIENLLLQHMSESSGFRAQVQFVSQELHYWLELKASGASHVDVRPNTRDSSSGCPTGTGHVSGVPRFKSRLPVLSTVTRHCLWRRKSSRRLKAPVMVLAAWRILN